jgi:hypothetical protein
MEHRWNEIDRGKPKYSGKKPVPVPLCPPQIPQGLTWDRTPASAVRGRRLTAWAMARPSSRVTGQAQDSECSNRTYKSSCFYLDGVCSAPWQEHCLPWVMLFLVSSRQSSVLLSQIRLSTWFPIHYSPVNLIHYLISWSSVTLFI